MVCVYFYQSLESFGEHERNLCCYTNIGRRPWSGAITTNVDGRLFRPTAGASVPLSSNLASRRSYSWSRVSVWPSQYRVIYDSENVELIIIHEKAREKEKKNLKIRAENDGWPKVTGPDCAARKVIECDATGEPSGGQRHRGYGDSHGPESGERGQIRFRRWGHILRRLGRRKSPRPRGLYGTQGPGSLFRIVALRFRGLRSLYLAEVILYTVTLYYAFDTIFLGTKITLGNHCYNDPIFNRGNIYFLYKQHSFVYARHKRQSCDS